ncbi:hypothetical protein C6501_11185 [Candidatus Poribacteria bacterium]|nr:MAG: hypothetical protein C6501_11185 [Candidatus Poribacteria bacterium]
MKKLNSFLGPVILSLFLTGCSTFSHIFFDDVQDDYDFRKVRWGYSQERVETIEQGKVVFSRTPDLLIYKSKIEGVPVLLVYTFRKNKLRSAGYMTQKPVRNAQNFVKKCIEKHGIPQYELTDGMMWQLPKTIVYVDGYTSHAIARNSKYQRSAGVLEFILPKPSEDDDLIVRWDGVLTYIDRNFYNELAETEFPLLDLSYYEKRLFGVLKRRASVRVRTQTGDTVTVPLQESE